MLASLIASAVTASVALTLAPCHATPEPEPTPTEQVVCDTFATPFIECIDGAGHVVASDIDYRDGGWYWGEDALGGDCPSEDSCIIAYIPDEDGAITTIPIIP
jgi:hypothetical protein